jgi:hypothetical protein
MFVTETHDKHTMNEKVNNMATKKYLDYAGLKRVLAKLLPGARKIWHGTLAEWEALSATEKAKYDQAEVIDEYTGVPVVVDKVESGNMNPVTSNAVAGCTTPDWANAITLAEGVAPYPYTVEKNGILVLGILLKAPSDSTTSDVNIRVNTYTAVHPSNRGTSIERTDHIIPVAKGQVITAEVNGTGIVNMYSKLVPYMNA